MPNEKFNLVFDQGGHATRAILFDSDSNILKHFECPITTNQSGELVVEHDAQELIASFHKVIGQVYSSLADNFGKIKTVGMATQRSSFVCWDKLTGEALTPVISWQDRRTVNELEKYQSHQDEIHQKTGLYLNPHYGASKMRWCLDSLNSVQQAKIENRLCIGPLSSFVLFNFLTGKPFVTDPANASRTLMMNYKSLQWDERLCLLFDISRELLPEIKPTHSNFGILEWQGHKIPMTLCTGDQSAAIYSAGKPEANKVYVNVGTGAFVQNISDELPKIEKSKLLASVVFTTETNKTYALEGTVNGAGRALQWLADKLNVEDYEKKIDGWCEQFHDPTLFLNGISGVGSPFWKADFKSRFIDAASNEEKFVAVLESIVFLIFVNIKVMITQRTSINLISIAGGVAKSNALCQKLADLSGLSIERDEQSEATAKGVQYLMSGREVSIEFNKTNFLPIENHLLDSRFNRWHEYMTRN